MARIHRDGGDYKFLLFLFLPSLAFFFISLFSLLPICYTTGLFIYIKRKNTMYENYYKNPFPEHHPPLHHPPYF